MQLFLCHNVRLVRAADERPAGLVLLIQRPRRKRRILRATARPAPSDASELSNAIPNVSHTVPNVPNVPNVDHFLRFGLRTRIAFVAISGFHPRETVVHLYLKSLYISLHATLAVEGCALVRN